MKVKNTSDQFSRYDCEMKTGFNILCKWWLFIDHKVSLRSFQRHVVCTRQRPGRLQERRLLDDPQLERRGVAAAGEQMVSTCWVKPRGHGGGGGGRRAVV